MKNTIIYIIISLISIQGVVAQNINWKAQEQNRRQIAYINFGFEYGVTTQLGYGYKLGNKLPIVLSADYSFPMGNELFDDHKVRMGGQIEALKWKNFSITAKAMMVYRRYANERVRIINFGAEISAIVGYYKPKWYIAGEVGFDKSVTSHLKHKPAMTDYFPDITDGWYIPTGGNYFYGVQGGATIVKDLDLNLRLGASSAQKNDEKATLPLYVQIGLIKRF